MKSDAYGSATLTTRGHARSRFTKTGMPPGVQEQDNPIDPDYQGPSYDEVYLKGKLVGIEDASEYDKDKGQLIIYPDMGEMRWKSRSSQYIKFGLVEGELQFFSAFGMRASYDELKRAFPGLPPMGESSYSGFMNVMADHVYGTGMAVDLDTAKAMVQAMNKGLDAERKSQSAFYTREPGSGGTGIDEEIILEISPEEATRKKNNNLRKNIDIDIRLAKASDATADKGINTQRVTLGQTHDQAEKAERAAYSAKKEKKETYLATQKELNSLKMDQEMDPSEKAQMIQDTRELLKTAKIAYDASTDAYQKAQEGTASALKGISGISAAASQADKAYYKNIQSLKKQKNQIGKKQKGGEQPIAEILLKQYIRERKHINLTECMDSYKREILTENAMQKFFKLFDQGKTDEDVLRYYALSGVVVPEPFVKKARDQYKNLKKAKLDIEFAEQEAKDFKSVTKEKPEEPKKIISRLFKEDLKYSTERKFNIPADLLDTLENKLKINPINRFIEKFKAINSIPPSYRAFLHNGQTFDIVYEEFSLLIKIGPKRYYIADLDERNLAIKHINKLLIGDVIKPEEEEEEEIETPPKSSPTPPPPSPEDDLDDDL